MPNVIPETHYATLTGPGMVGLPDFAVVDSSPWHWEDDEWRIEGVEKGKQGVHVVQWRAAGTFLEEKLTALLQD